MFRRRRAAEPESRFGRWRRVFEWLECCVISSSEAVEDMTHDTVNSSPGSIFEFERTCSLAHKRARRANVRQLTPKLSLSLSQCDRALIVCYQCLLYVISGFSQSSVVIVFYQWLFLVISG